MMSRPLQVDEIWAKRIVEQVDGLEYGSVVVTVHAGRIVQIERSERKRYDSGGSALASSSSESPASSNQSYKNTSA